MKLTKKDLSLEKGVKREWVISNGIGGFASSSVLDANTRRYHGLLIAPLLPPARRHLLISKLDESIQIGDNTYNLFTNICKNYISDGYKYLESFEKEYIPIFKYKVEDIEITKKISLVHGRNTVVVVYNIKSLNTGGILKLAPVINFRDFHSMTPNHNFSLSQKVDGRKSRIEIDGHAETPIYIYLTEGEYIEHKNDIFKNIYYLKENERGFSAEEDLVVTGRYEINIPANTEKIITFIGSLEENIESINGEDVIKSEIERLNKIIKNANLEASVDDIIEDNKDKVRVRQINKECREYNEFIKDMLIASDSFIIDRPVFGTKSVLAGFPWFLDWGRDTFIAFEGLLLITKRFEDAKNVIRTFIRDVKLGLVPNGYSGFDGRPMYNSVDSALLLFEVIKKYLEYTNDYEFIREEVYEKLKFIIDNYKIGTNLDNNNIYLDKDGLIVSGTENTQNTWMDAKIGDYVVTPRNGKVVEVNALWYNALKILEELATKFGETKISELCKELAKKCKTSFNKKFFNSKRKCLYDVLGDEKIRPNQLFAISLSYPVMNLNNENTKLMFDTVTDKLLTRYGLRTLSRLDEEYTPVYEGDSYKRDMSYHQGVSWVWLLGLYSDAFENLIEAEKDKLKKNRMIDRYKIFVNNVYTTFKKELYDEDCIQSISELYNSRAPYTPGGTCSQAWSVSEVLKICVKKQYLGLK